MLTVAVSVASGTDNIISAFPSLNAYRVLIAVGLVALLAAANLRGVRESGRAFAVPTYLFISGITVLIVTGLIRYFFTDAGMVSETARYTVTPEPAYENMAGLALLFFALRAFASGCTALTGVEAIANGVPAFRPPKSRNAATTLALMGGIAAAMFAGVTALALLVGRQVRREPLRPRGLRRTARPSRSGPSSRSSPRPRSAATARSASSSSRPPPRWC